MLQRSVYELEVFTPQVVLKRLKDLRDAYTKDNVMVDSQELAYLVTLIYRSKNSQGNVECLKEFFNLCQRLNTNYIKRQELLQKIIRPRYYEEVVIK